MLPRQQEKSGRIASDREVADARIGEGAVAGQALVVQRREDRIERVLDGAQVASRGAGADLAALDEDDPRSAVGHDRRGRAADDAATDDDDVRARARSVESIVVAHAREDIGLSICDDAHASCLHPEPHEEAR